MAEEGRVLTGVGLRMQFNDLTGIRAVTDRYTAAREVPITPGDFDFDGDVDQSDFGHLQDCYSGPGISQLSESCQDALLDTDDDVDQNDFAIFQGCMSGAGIPADPGCN
jgi:hypothetical protein